MRLRRLLRGFMGTKKKRVKRPARGSISRDSLTDVALAIADRDGVEAVTLRALASEVGVASPMALYTYFASKEDLVVAMRERVVGQMREQSKSRGTWQALLEGTAHGLSRAAREHPNWIPLVFHPGAPPSSILVYAGRLIELMLDDDFSLADALRAHMGVLSFALGSVYVERALTTATGDDLMAKRLSLLQQVVAQAPEGRYASLASVAAQIDRWSFDETFEFGLEALLAGIESQRRPAGGSTARGAEAQRSDAERRRR
jgi:AcrR family transcriptional regulator